MDESSHSKFEAESITSHVSLKDLRDTGTCFDRVELSYSFPSLPEIVRGW